MWIYFVWVPVNDVFHNIISHTTIESIYREFCNLRKKKLLLFSCTYAMHCIHLTRFRLLKDNFRDYQIASGCILYSIVDRNEYEIQMSRLYRDFNKNQIWDFIRVKY